MTRIVLDILNDKDVELLLPLLKRLGVIVSNQADELSKTEIAHHQRVVEQGGKTIENFESFMESFELSRQDRKMPFAN